MNENTRRQWERYIGEHGVLSTHERLVLYWLVHDHSAHEGFTRPGIARLVQMTGGQPATVLRALRSLTARGDIVLTTKGTGRLADEYSIPWLENPVALRNRSANPALRNRTANSSANRSTSSPSSKENRSRRRAPHSASPAPQSPEAMNVCAVCELTAAELKGCCPDHPLRIEGCLFQPAVDLSARFRLDGDPPEPTALPTMSPWE